MIIMFMFFDQYYESVLCTFSVNYYYSLLYAIKYITNNSYSFISMFLIFIYFFENSNEWFA